MIISQIIRAADVVGHFTDEEAEELHGFFIRYLRNVQPIGNNGPISDRILANIQEILKAPDDAFDASNS